MSSPMSNLINHLKQFRLARIVLPVLASGILLLGTACNPSSPSVSGTGSYQEGRKPQTELYRPVQPDQGGMNRFSDTDPRSNTSGVSSKANQLIKNAERNINKVQNSDELVDEIKTARPFKEGSKDVTERIGNTVEGLKQDISEGTQRGVKNLQRNTSQATQGVQETVDDARQNTSEAVRDTARGAKQTVNQAKGSLNNARQDVKNQVSKTIDQGERSISQADKNLRSLRSEAQPTPDLDAKDLANRAKNTFNKASENVGELNQGTAIDR